MSEYWIAAGAGAALGGVLLMLFARVMPAKPLADYGFLTLNAMLAVYIGARLVTGTLGDVMIETAIATVWVIAAKFLMTLWLPSIGLMIIAHGCYDAFVGPHTGVASWYPPLCAGFDFIVGAGLILVLVKKQQKIAV